jgi:hypothetical protein
MGMVNCNIVAIMYMLLQYSGWLCQNSYFTLSNRSLLFSPSIHSLVHPLCQLVFHETLVGIVNLMHMSYEENPTYNT